MATVRVKTHIPESRQITLTLPAEFPLGEVELEIIVRRPLRDLPQVIETEQEFEEFMARIRAFRDEANRETKSGPYADE